MFYPLQHPLHTLHKSLFAFHLCFYLSWYNKAQYTENVAYFLPSSILKRLHKNSPIFISLFLKILFIFLEKTREGEREISMCGCLLCTLYWEPDPQPRHVPWLGIELATLWFTACAPFSELHWPGLHKFFFFKAMLIWQLSQHNLTKLFQMK